MAADKPDSVFGDVRIGVITYSSRALPGSAEEVLRYCLECGIGGIELMSDVAERYAGSPAPGRGGFGRSPAGGRRQMTPKKSRCRQMGRGLKGMASFHPNEQVPSVPQDV